MQHKNSYIPVFGAGQKRWQTSLDDRVTGLAPSPCGRMLIASLEGCILVCLDAGDGSLCWSREVPVPDFREAPLDGVHVAGKLVVVSHTSSEKLYLYDLGSGQPMKNDLPLGTRCYDFDQELGVLICRDWDSSEAEENPIIHLEVDTGNYTRPVNQNDGLIVYNYQEFQYSCGSKEVVIYHSGATHRFEVKYARVISILGVGEDGILLAISIKKDRKKSRKIVALSWSGEVIGEIDPDNYWKSGAVTNISYTKFDDVAMVVDSYPAKLISIDFTKECLRWEIDNVAIGALVGDDEELWYIQSVGDCEANELVQVMRDSGERIRGFGDPLYELVASRNGLIGAAPGGKVVAYEL